MNFSRRPQHRYHDPLARVWIECAERVGFRIERSAEVYASSDGRGVLCIGHDEILDPDDNLAQMILHELCHALVEGETGERQVDWGLDNASRRHVWREQACLRLQAWLADSVGLRDFFAPTTDFRVCFWASLPADPFAAPEEAGGRAERSCVAGRRGAFRASQPRWAGPLRDALQRSAAIAAVVPRDLGHDAVAGLPSLWDTAATPPAPHPAGQAPVALYHAGRRCADCAWGFTRHGTLRCRRAPLRRLDVDTPACMRWEPAAELDCRSCGACCREAYDAVEVGPREAVVKRHPQLVQHDGSRRKLVRQGERCAALIGGETAAVPYACSIYDDRPRTCRDFTLGSAHCLEARRRVGLSL